jgi:hypothetical protein
MKKGSGGGSDGLGGEVLAEIECTYHLHTRTRAPCWRANIQMYSPESGLGRRHIFNKRYGMHRKSKRRARAYRSQGRQGNAKPTASSFHHHSPISTTTTRIVYMLYKDIIARANYMPINTSSKR